MIALSYSRLSDYRQCPHKFNLKYIQKCPNFAMDSKSPHLIRGENVHRALENYVVKRRAGENGIPESSLSEVEQTKSLIDGLMSIYDLHPEHKCAINDKFEPVDWFARDAWFRAIFDVVGFGNDLFLGDYKTGKIYDYEGTLERPGQLHLSAIVGAAVWPTFDKVQTVYVYVDHKQTKRETFDREHCMAMREVLIAEHARVNADKDFIATKNKFCNWCEALPSQCDFKR